MLNSTDNPVKEAEIYYLNMDMRDERYWRDYEDNLQDYTVFESFMYDLDYTDPRIGAIFAQRNGDVEDQAYGYSILMEMFEEYTKEFTEMFNE